MALRLETITSTDDLAALTDAWAQLARATDAIELFAGPAWLMAWWQAYREVLHAEPLVFAGFDGDELVCLAPLYRRVDREHGPKVREVRFMGDAGPRPPTLGVLVREGYEAECAEALAHALDTLTPQWDVIDLQPVSDVSRLRAYFVQRMAAAGKHVRTVEAGGTVRIGLRLAGVDLDEVLPEDARARVYTDDTVALRKGLAALRRLSRIEWAAGDEASPIAEPEAMRVLDDVVRRLGADGHVRLARLDDDTGEAVAAALVIDDDERAVVLALAVDPEHLDRGVATRLLEAEARAAIGRGLAALEVIIGGDEHVSPALPVQRTRSLQLRIFNTSASAALARTYGAVRRQVDAAREAPAVAAAGARAAWTRIRGAAASVAAYGRFHLYRGELWTRGVESTAGLSLGLFHESDLDRLPERERADMVHALELDEAYCRTKWRRDDLVLLARIDGRPAGVTWCARSSVHVAELDRSITPGPHECYIYDVFVAPHARGRAVAPAMLEFLAHELRQLDMYRSWALIDPANIASVRAFQKASYTSVADIVYARMATVERVTVRPPDPEAKKLLGLS